MHSVRRTLVIAALTVGMCAAPVALMTASATAAPSASGARVATPKWPVVQKGNTGGRVRAIQYLLNQRDRAGLTVDGVFGAKTEAAVKTFQKKVKVTVDGKVGPMTWPKLIVTVKRGDRSAAVRAVQWQLHFEYGYTSVTVDAIFGPKTEAAVKSFQKAHGLTQDGIVGPNTWLHLEADHS